MQKNKPFSNNPTLTDYLKWDVYTWGKALYFWSKILKSKSIANGLALEIGSKDGGLSLYLANEFGFKVICTDITETTEEAKQKHKKFNINNRIDYEIADALALNYESNKFDVVIFKSVLGSIGKNDSIDLQKKAVEEIYRVLKPGGILLFAENAKATILHKIFRKIFRRWASYWRYITLDEMSDMLSKFKSKELHSSGFASVFFSSNNIKKIMLSVDNFLEKIFPEKFRYIIYGYAVK